MIMTFLQQEIFNKSSISGNFQNSFSAVLSEIAFMKTLVLCVIIEDVTQSEILAMPL